MSRKLDLAEQLQREFEDLVTEKEQRKYGKFVRENTAALIDKRPKNKREALKLLSKNKIDTKTSTKMFTALNGVMTKILNPETREARKKLKPLDGLMRVYNVNNPKSFAKEVYSMTTGSGMSERNKRFRPLLLSYYDGFTENIESEAKQAERAMQRAELEKVSSVFKDLEDLREQRIPIGQVKKQLIAKYGDPKRVKRALNTELHEQAERVKVEQSKFMGYTHKKWNTQKDERVRRTRFHNQIAGVSVPIDDKFKAAGLEADYAGDLSLPVGERINCRCFITYHNEAQGRISAAPIITPPRPRPAGTTTQPPVTPPAPKRSTRQRQVGRPIKASDFAVPRKIRENDKSKRHFEKAVKYFEDFDKIAKNNNDESATRDNLNYLYQHTNDFLIATLDPTKVKTAYYNPRWQEIVVPDFGGKNNIEAMAAAKTFVHEMGHAIDHELATKIFGDYGPLKTFRLSSYKELHKKIAKMRGYTQKQGPMVTEKVFQPIVDDMNDRQKEIITSVERFEDAVNDVTKKRNETLKETETYKEAARIAESMRNRWNILGKEEFLKFAAEKDDNRILQDMMDAFSRGQFRDNGNLVFGHGKSYYSRPTARQSEIFTELGQLKLYNQEYYEMVRSDFPELVEAYETLIEQATSYLEEEVVDEV